MGWIRLSHLFRPHPTYCCDNVLSVEFDVRCGCYFCDHTEWSVNSRSRDGCIFISRKSLMVKSRCSGAPASVENIAAYSGRAGVGSMDSVLLQLLLSIDPRLLITSRNPNTVRDIPNARLSIGCLRLTSTAVSAPMKNASSHTGGHCSPWSCVLSMSSCLAGRQFAKGAPERRRNFGRQAGN